MKNKKRILGVGLALVAGLSLASCGSNKDKNKTDDKGTSGDGSQEQVVTKYSITFNINGHGTAQTALNDVTAIPETLPTLTADGYTFGGWYLDAALTTKAVAGSTITTNVTLYAKWTAVQSPAEVKYSVTYNINGHGTAQDVLNDVTALPETLPTLTADGYTFGGWYLDEALTTAATAGQAITANTTLYAKWTEVKTKFSVTYNVNGHGEAQTALSEVQTLPEILPTLTDADYNFAGWYLDEALTTAATAGQAITADITLYAKWTIKTAYQKLTEDENNIYHNDFETAGTLTDITNDDSIWDRDNGAYYCFSDKGKTYTEGQNKVEIVDGILKMTDLSDNGSQAVVVAYAQEGVVEGTMDLMLETAKTKLTYLQFFGYSSSYDKFGELIGLRTDEGKSNVQYRVNIGDPVDGVESTPFTTSLSVYFKFNLETGKATITVNGAKIVDDLDIGITAFAGFKIVSADSGKCYVNADNISVVNTKLTLAEYKVKASNYIDTVITEMNIDNNYTTYKTEIEAAVASAKASITSAETRDDVDAIMQQFEQNIDYPSDEEIVMYKARAKNIEDQIDELPKTDASNADILAAEDEIIAARDTYNNAVENVKKYVSQDKLDALKAIEEKLAEVKASATPADEVIGAANSMIDELNELKETDYTTNYTTNAETIKQLFDEAINSLKTIKDASNITEENKANYISQINEVKNTLVAKLADVKNDLAQAKAYKKDEIDTFYNDKKSYYTTNQDAFLKAYNDTLAQIATATTVTEVEEISTSLMEAVKNDTEQAAYDALPSVVVSEEQISVSKLTLNEASKSSGSLTGDVGIFTFSGTATYKYESEVYGVSFYGSKTGNDAPTITFTVKKDGATFMMGLYSNNSKRSVVLTKDGETGISKLSTNVDTNPSYSFDNEGKNLDTVLKGYLIWENLSAGQYTVTFTGGEIKAQNIYLFDHEPEEVSKKVLSIDADISGGTTKDSIVVKVNAKVEGVTDTVALSDGLAYKYYDESGTLIDESDNTTVVASIEVTYTNGEKFITGKFNVPASTGSDGDGTGEINATALKSESYETGTIEIAGEYLVYTDPSGNKTIC